jgi:hypothetical protein
MLRLQDKSMQRALFAILIALAVALAPVGAALAATGAMSKAAMEDCQGKASKGQSCCDTMAKVPDPCGIKCCKLMGMIVALPAMDAPGFSPPEAARPQKPPDWHARPRPPPPRS